MPRRVLEILAMLPGIGGARQIGRPAPNGGTLTNGYKTFPYDDPLFEAMMWEIDNHLCREG